MTEWLNWTELCSCIDIYNCYVFLLDWSLDHYVVEYDHLKSAVTNWRWAPARDTTHNSPKANPCPRASVKDWMVVFLPDSCDEILNQPPPTHTSPRVIVSSNFLRPHGLKPTRLFCPWNFPVKNPGVGCHYPLQRGLAYVTLVMLMYVPSIPFLWRAFLNYKWMLNFVTNFVCIC